MHEIFPLILEKLLLVKLYTHNTTLFLYNALMIPVLFFSLYFLITCFRTLTLKSSPQLSIKPKIKNWPFVTIQIPTFNEIVAIRCAKKCLNFNYPSNKFEIIIGDDSNNKNVSRKIDKFANQHPNKIKVTRRGLNVGFKAGNLNHMIKYSKGEIIIIFDSDFIPGKNFLEAIVKPFINDKKVGCVQARWGFINPNQNLVTILASSTILFYHRIVAPLNKRFNVPLLFGSGMAIRKKNIEKLGGWQEWSLTEDVEFALKSLRNGYKTIYLDDLVVKGEVPFTVKDLKKQQKKWAYGTFNAFIDHWRGIIFGNFSINQKICIITTLLGYFSTLFLALFIIFGLVSFWTGNPEPFNIQRFLSESIRSIAISSGFLISSIIALKMENCGKNIGKLIVSCFSVGFVVTLGICQGLINSIIGKRMNWDMIQKKGNNLKK